MYIDVLEGLKCICMLFKIIQHMYVTESLYDMYMSFKHTCCITNLLLEDLHVVLKYLLFNMICR